MRRASGSQLPHLEVILRMRHASTRTPTMCAQWSIRSGRTASSWVRYHVSSAASGNVCAVDDLAECLVVGVAVAPSDVAADHRVLFVVGAVVGAV